MMSLHWGTPGAGKTYNMMKYELLPALAVGRPVFTNINGLDSPSCIEAISKYTKKSIDEIHELLNVFPQEGRIFFGAIDKQGNECSLSIGDDLHRLVRFGDESTKGDLIILDEASDPELFDAEKRKVNDEMWLFFKKHRHYNVDIILMAHHPRDLIPKIARLCAEYTYYRKLIGVSDKRYRYEKWLAGYSSSSHGTKVKTGIETYESEVFDCYKSTVAGDGKSDGSMDNRFSFMKSSGLKLLIVGVLIFAVGVPLIYSNYFGSDSLLIKSPKTGESKLLKAQDQNFSSTVSAGGSVNPVATVPPVFNWVDDLFLKNDLTYEGIVRYGRKVTGWVSFWKGKEFVTRLTFEEMKEFGARLTYPGPTNNIMRIIYNDKKLYAVSSLPIALEQPMTNDTNVSDIFQ